MSFGETALGQAVVAAGWTASLLAVVLLLYALFVGAGRLVAPSLARASRSAPDPDAPLTASFWLGLAAVVALLQLWSFVLPVDWRAGAVFVVAGLSGLALLVRDGRRPSRSWSAIAALLAVAPILLHLANQALGDPKHGDSGLYHFNSIRWATEHPVVPGLGSLHARLAFNQSYFLYAALLDFHPFFDRGYHLANALLLTALGIELGRGVGGLLRRGGGEKGRWALRLLLLPALAGYATSTVEISSPAPDAAVFVLGLVLFIHLGDLALRQDDRWTLPVILVTAPVLVTFKLTLLVFAGAMAVTALALRSRDGPAAAKPTVRHQAAAAGGAALVILLPWMGRGVVASGYPLFPSTALGLPVDWRLPEQLARLHAEIVRSWARKPGAPVDEVLADWAWLDGWLAGAWPTLLAAGLAVGVGVLVVQLRGRGRPPGGIPAGRWAAPLPAVAAALAFWFWAAPALRFIEPVLWGVAAWGMLPAALAVLEGWSGGSSGGAGRRGAAWALAGSVVVGSWVWLAALDPPGFNVVPEPVRTSEMVRVRTDHGLELLVARDGHPWDSELPASPFLRMNIAPRGPRLRDGFRLVGDSASFARIEEGGS